MATHKVRPDRGSAEDQGSHQRQARRNRMLEALAVIAGIVIVAAIGVQAVIVAGGSAEPDTSAERAEIGPAVTGPNAAFPDGRDGYGIPPKGTAPSTPKEGKLVAHYGHPQSAGFVYVYADGRVISQGGEGNEGRDGFYERRLTPEGVELVRSGAVKAERFQLSSNPVPADAWEDPEARPYVPARYAICGLDPARLGTLPPRAEGLLRGKARHDSCFEVTTEEARALDHTLSDSLEIKFRLLLPHAGSTFTQPGTGGHLEPGESFGSAGPAVDNEFRGWYRVIGSKCFPIGGSFRDRVQVRYVSEGVRYVDFADAHTDDWDGRLRYMRGERNPWQTTHFQHYELRYRPRTDTAVGYRYGVNDSVVCVRFIPLG